MSTRMLLVMGGALCLVLGGCEESPNTPVVPDPPEPTNTNTPTTPITPAEPGKVRRDPAATPMDQSNQDRNIELTAAVRRSLLQHDTLSVNAKNVKIITDEAGTVTLRGVVESAAERDTVEQVARAVAGVARVSNQLEVKAP